MSKAETWMPGAEGSLQSMVYESLRIDSDVAAQRFAKGCRVDMDQLSEADQIENLNQYFNLVIAMGIKEDSRSIRASLVTNLPASEWMDNFNKCVKKHVIEIWK